jgi:hypothetical protein
MAIGQELLDIPFGEMLRNLAFAVAEGQLALDKSSIATLQHLMTTNVGLVTQVTEIIEPSVQQVQVGGQMLPVTGATIRASGAAPVTLTLLQAGLQPTFYQFTEATLEVKLSISVKRTEESESEPNSSSPSNVLVKGFKTRAFASSVNYRTSNTFSYTADGASVIRATLRPVPPPPRITPRTVTVNALVTPPIVTIND